MLWLDGLAPWLDGTRWDGMNCSRSEYALVVWGESGGVVVL